MANITPQLNKILSAVYGEEVRGSIHDALVAMNGESSSAMEYASTAQGSAANSATAAATSASNAAQSATSASTSAGSASTNATLAESYTKGGTGTRTGEDSDNAKYYKDLAKSYAESASQGIEPATTTKIGGVKPDGTTITVDQDGTIHGSAQIDVATSKSAGIVKPDGTTITVDADGTIHGVGDSNVSVDGTTIVKNSNDVISVNEYVGTKAQAEANLSSIPDGATVYTTDESGELSVIDTELNASSNHAIANSTVTTALSNKANKSDIANISITGSTNNTGSTITAGTLFYWNGGLFKATTDIPNNSTIVLESNCSSWQVFIEMGLMFSKTDNLTVSNNTSSLDNCTSLASVWQAVKWNYLNGYGKICRSSIGTLDNTSVKNVIPNPPNFGNYTSIRCKFEASEDIIVIYAIGEHIGKLAKCYLFRDGENYYLTDWQILR